MAAIAASGMALTAATAQETPTGQYAPVDSTFSIIAVEKDTGLLGLGVQAMARSIAFSAAALLPWRRLMSAIATSARSSSGEALSAFSASAMAPVRSFFSISGPIRPIISKPRVTPRMRRSSTSGCLWSSLELGVVAQNPRGLPHHRQSAVVQCLLPSRGAASLDYRASHVSAYLLRGFRSLMPFVQLVNSVPTPFDQLDDMRKLPILATGGHLLSVS